MIFMRKQDYGVLALAVLMIIAMVLVPMMGDVVLAAQAREPGV